MTRKFRRASWMYKNHLYFFFFYSFRYNSESSFCLVILIFSSGPLQEPDHNHDHESDVPFGIFFITWGWFLVLTATRRMKTGVVLLTGNECFLRSKSKTSSFRIFCCSHIGWTNFWPLPKLKKSHVQSIFPDQESGNRGGGWQMAPRKSYLQFHDPWVMSFSELIVQQMYTVPYRSTVGRAEAIDLKTDNVHTNFTRHGIKKLDYSPQAGWCLSRVCQHTRIDRVHAFWMHHASLPSWENQYGVQLQLQSTGLPVYTIVYAQRRDLPLDFLFHPKRDRFCGGSRRRGGRSRWLYDLVVMLLATA